MVNNCRLPITLCFVNPCTFNNNKPLHSPSSGMKALLAASESMSVKMLKMLPITLCFVNPCTFNNNKPLHSPSSGMKALLAASESMSVKMLKMPKFRQIHHKPARLTMMDNRGNMLQFYKFPDKQAQNKTNKQTKNWLLNNKRSHNVTCIYL
ncbi:hypothetical protein EGR_07714 [Echinococcus granulosus]|uniref:Uncharacterized protein n=1 Tax=Echinococcus granulosus TaxID=6210 RepID=W6UHC8_ECHGR|nr:hypothetical protein EGR_07714 [Echinococcus granulosus]EUB57472.1 hypothetical protein EGR_07714 [Echinococcus granulosus]